MRRKVSLIGPSTLMISLPSKWVKEYGVKKGDELDIFSKGQELQVRILENQSSSKITLDLDGLNANLIRCLLYAAYRNGNQEIEAHFTEKTVEDQNTKKQVTPLDVISDVADTLIGVEILRQGKNYCLIKEVSSVNHEEFLNTMQRIFFTLINTSKDINDAIKGSNEDILQRIHHTADRRVNKLSDFCFRVIKKGGVVQQRKSSSYYSIITSLEDIGDMLKKIARDTEINNKQIQKQLTIVSELLETLYSFFCDYRKELLKQSYALKREVGAFRGENSLQEYFQGINTACSTLISEIIALHLLEKEE